MSSLSLAFDILARDRASSKFDDVGNASERTGGKLKGMGKMAGAALLGVGAAGVAGAAKALQAFAGFEQQMNEVFTLLPGISDEAMGAMTDQVKGFSKEFGVLPEDVVPALYQSLSAGVPQDNVFEFLETAQKAAKGGVTELTTAVDGISSVVNAYGSDVISAADASDQMFTAVRLGKTNFEELSSSLSNVTPIASGLGVQFGDVTAALATMTAKGVPTAQATTQLRSLFVELSKAGGEAATTFEKMSGKTFQEFVSEGGNTAQALELMQQAADDSGVALQDMFGSVEAGSAALTLAGGEGFTDNIDEMAGAAGATEKAFDQMNQGLGPIMDRVKANLSVLLIDVGERLAPLAEAALNGMSKAFEVVGPIISDVFSRIGPVVQGFIADFQSGGDTIGRVIEVLSGAFEFLRTTFETHGAEIQAIFEQVRAIVTGVFEALGLIITTWVTIITDLWQRFGADIVNYARETFDNVIEFISAAFEIVQGIFEVFAGIFTGDWGRMWDGIKMILAGVWDAIRAIVEQALNIIDTAIQVGLGLISAAWSLAWNAMSTLVSDIVEKVVGFVGGLPGKAGAAFSAAWGAFWSTFTELAGGISSFVGDRIDDVVGFVAGLPGRIAEAAAGAFDGLSDAFKSAINAIINVWNSFEFPSFEIGGWDTPFGKTPSFTTPTIGFPYIEPFHDGGIFRAPFGQREGLARLLDGERVLNLEETAAFDAAARRDAGAGGLALTASGDVYIRDELDIEIIARSLAANAGVFE